VANSPIGITTSGSTHSFTLVLPHPAEENLSVFSGSDLEGFVFRVSLQMYSVSAAPEDIIINSADGVKVDSTVYILLTGKVKLYGNNHGGDSQGADQSIRTMEPHDGRACFGSRELFDDKPPPDWCVQASEYCDLAYIEREALGTVIRNEECGVTLRRVLADAFPWALRGDKVQAEPEPESSQESAVYSPAASASSISPKTPRSAGRQRLSRHRSSRTITQDLTKAEPANQPHDPSSNGDANRDQGPPARVDRGGPVRSDDGEWRRSMQAQLSTLSDLVSTTNRKIDALLQHKSGVEETLNPIGSVTAL